MALATIVIGGLSVATSPRAGDQLEKHLQRFFEVTPGPRVKRAWELYARWAGWVAVALGCFFALYFAF
jgi:hypothetical protein